MWLNSGAIAAGGHRRAALNMVAKIMEPLGA